MFLATIIIVFGHVYPRFNIVWMILDAWTCIWFELLISKFYNNNNIYYISIKLWSWYSYVINKFSLNVNKQWDKMSNYKCNLDVLTYY